MQNLARLMETLLQDIRFGFRQLMKQPGFAALAIISMALGIGANTSIFSLVDTALLRPLAVKEPSQLVELYDFKPDLEAYLKTAPSSVKTRTLADLIAFERTDPHEKLHSNDRQEGAEAVSSRSQSGKR